MAKVQQNHYVKSGCRCKRTPDLTVWQKSNQTYHCIRIRIIFPDLGYQEALKECNITTLHQRRQWLTERLFNEIKDNSLPKLHGLLPPRNLSTVALRRKRAFNVPICRTNRFKNSFIMHNAAIF